MPRKCSNPRLRAWARAFWFRAKILEITALTLIEPGEQLFCERHKRLALSGSNASSKRWHAISRIPRRFRSSAREAGCSPFYLSRIFAEHTGTTISRYLRNLRLERAAELLRSGRSNVTEAAMAVGYSSLSHFSKAFAEMFGVCPYVFPLSRRTNR